MNVMRHVRNLAQTSVLGAYALHAYHQARAKMLSRLPDEEFAQRSYERFSGRRLNLANPTTFDEKQWWLKVNYRDSLMVQCTDKLEVRKYVEGKGLGHILHPLINSYSDPEDIDWRTLPDSFYLKTNNSSATNIRCDDRNAFDTRRATRLLKLYLKRNHYALSREWNYRDIEPRVLIEPIIQSPRGELIDYRFMCSYGVCKGIFADVDTADGVGRHRGDAKRNVYDKEWNLLDVQVTRPRINDRELGVPTMLDEMIRVAESLSEPFPFCRVDLYNPMPGEIIFGEITFFHAGGNNDILPIQYQLELGRWITLPPEKGATAGLSK